MSKKKFPRLTMEKKLWRRGYVAVGVDEVGVGPLAGPVVAAAVCILPLSSTLKVQSAKFRDFLKMGIRDSKSVSAPKREQIFEALTTHPAVVWGVGSASPKTIDRLNIYHAGLLAMKKAVSQLMRKCKGQLPKRWYLHIDGRSMIPGIAVRQKCVVDGDAKIFSIACASIIAKVTRDRLMCEYAKEYPEYKFDKHKGYGTKLHHALIKKHGLCFIHRRSFLKNLV